MKPGREAERFRPLFIDIWIGNIIVSGVEGVIFTLIFLVVTIFCKTTHASSTILVTTQLVLVFLIGSLKALNIFIHSIKKSEYGECFKASSVSWIRYYYTGHHSSYRNLCSGGGHLHGS